MSWYIYSETAIDHNWECLPSVAQMAQKLGGHTAALLTEVHQGLPPSTEDVDRFLEAWKSARSAASMFGWEGDFMQGPVVFWLPAPNFATFLYGFVFKQRNNGQTYVVSPCELIWLGKPVSAPPPPLRKPVLGNLLDDED